MAGMAHQELTLHFFLVKTRRWRVHDPWFRQVSYIVTVQDDGTANGVIGASAADHKWSIRVKPIQKSGQQLEEGNISTDDNLPLSVNSVKVKGSVQCEKGLSCPQILKNTLFLLSADHPIRCRSNADP